MLDVYLHVIWWMSYYAKPLFTVALTTQCLTNLGCLSWYSAYYSMSTRCLSLTFCWKGHQNTGHQSNPRTDWYSMLASGDTLLVLYSHSILTQINTRLVVIAFKKLVMIEIFLCIFFLIEKYLKCLSRMSCIFILHVF